MVLNEIVITYKIVSLRDLQLWFLLFLHLRLFEHFKFQYVISSNQILLSCSHRQKSSVKFRGCLSHCEYLLC
jgi:hypothetical protein